MSNKSYAGVLFALAGALVIAVGLTASQEMPGLDRALVSGLLALGAGLLASMGFLFWERPDPGRTAAAYLQHFSGDVTCPCGHVNKVWSHHASTLTCNGCQQEYGVPKLLALPRARPAEPGSMIG